MPIYRGEGGSGESSTNALANEVAQDAAEAANSASQAATSATAAANSATAAANSATAAAASETAAETAETNAETAETNAAASATAAATSETNAATSETNAATSETNAATSASNASTSETNAANSASSASTSASNAATSETNAATSATNAATSETNAATSASQAATSATNAATSASDAATTYDNFDDRYLGEKTSDPSVDNDGDALITGALYFNSTAGQMRIWDGSAWEAAYLPASGYLHLSGGTMTGALELHANPSNNLEAATKQYVDDIAAEGIQYHTPVRVEVEGNLTATYNNGTAGVGATLTNAGTQAALVIDDITMVVNDRVLIYEQTDATQNGIYTVTDIGSASTNWVLTRATDADSYAPSDPDALAQGSGFFVQEGTLGAGEKYVCNTVGTITFGTTNISFVQVATAQIYTAGTGISLNGSVINNTGLLTTGSTATDLAITSADINGGNIDGTIIGATTPAAATVAAFTSNGIDDNATSTQFTIGLDDAQFFNPVLPLSVGLTVGENTSIRGDLDCEGFTSTGIDDNANQSALLLDSVGYTTLVHSQQTTGEGLTLQNLNTNLSVGTAINFELPIVGTGTEASIDYQNTGSASAFDLNFGVGSLSARISDITLNSSGEILFNTFSSERMRIQSTGSVSLARDLYVNGGDAYIGQYTSETGNLTLYGGASGFEGAQMNFHTTGDYGGSGNSGIFAIDVYAESLRFLNNVTNGAFEWYTPGNAKVALSINSNGTVDFTDDVFTTGDFVAGKNSGAIALTINDGGGNSNITFNHQNKTPDQNGNAARIEVNTDSTSGAYMHFEGLSNVTGGTLVTLNDMARMYADSGDFHANGNVIAYSTSISDERLKENVEQVTGALDMLDQIRGVTFDRKDTGKKSAGVIAQELEQVMPYAIYETALPLKTGSDDDVYKLVEYDALHAVLIEAIKELREEVEALKNDSSD